jgi:hypothetical protein
MSIRRVFIAFTLLFAFAFTLSAPLASTAYACPSDSGGYC